MEFSSRKLLTINEETDNIDIRCKSLEGHPESRDTVPGSMRVQKRTGSRKLFPFSLKQRFEGTPLKGRNEKKVDLKKGRS